MTDVIVQWCIEHKTGDIDYVFNKSIMNSTQYAKVHRQTVYLANRATMYFRNKGFIIGNNINKYNDLSEEETIAAEMMRQNGSQIDFSA